MRKINLRLVAAVVFVSASSAIAQVSLEPANLVRLDAVVSTPITPDTAVLTMAAERSGSDSPAITQQVNKLMGDAVREAKTMSGVEAITGNFSTQQQYDNRGNVIGWTVRSDLILKSKDFGTLGKLSGNLSQSLKIVGSGFEVSRELRAREETVLLQRGLEAFQAKAKTAAQTLGFGGYTLRDIHIQQAQLEGGNQPRPMMLIARGAMADAAPVQIEAGRTAINLTVSGSIQLK
ncbi:MAG: hypothetical protein RLY82_1648 [Pseudomonadota bacterium]|jgi:predicted secreted protein